MSVTRSQFVGLLLAAAAAAGCALHANPHGYQALPHTVRIETVPPGAEVFLPRWNLTLVAPCDLERKLEADEELVIRKQGYRTWRGRLQELPQVARNTYRLVLEPE